MGESCQRAVIFNVEFKKGQVLSQMLTNSDIIMGHVFEHRSIEPLLIQKLDKRTIPLVFPEDIEV